MAWHQLPDRSYVLHSSITHSYIEQDANPPNRWFIRATFSSNETLTVSGAFLTEGAAQNALDQFVASTGGTF
jgi:hypothetical protein